MDAPLKGLNKLSLKEVNRRQVVSALYHSGGMSKQQLVNELQLSLSTVDQYIRTLSAVGLVQSGNCLASTGGRPPRLLTVNPDYKKAVGIAVLNHVVHFAACDLFGRERAQQSCNLDYRHDKSYFTALSQAFESFLQANSLKREDLLSPYVAVQGLTDREGNRIVFGPLFDGAKLDAATLSLSLGLKINLCHDSYAACVYELWQHPELKQGVMFMLNRNFGGALFINGEVVTGLGGTAGTLEHYCVNPHGKLCYCGSRGCLETYCAADVLLTQSGCADRQEFFIKLRGGDSRLIELWQEYLQVLAQVARNVLCITDGSLLLSGYLSPYINEDDKGTLLRLINQNLPFKLTAERLVTGRGGDTAPALGAAQCALERYLNQEFSIRQVRGQF